MKKLFLAGLLLFCAGAGNTGPSWAFDIKRVDDSVVRVQRALRQTATGKLRGFGHGSGFVIAPEYVVTNYHVIDTSKQTIPDGTTFLLVIPDGAWKTDRLRPAQIIWRSKPLDLAVLRVPGLTRPPVELSSAAPTDSPGKGETVYAIGFPGASDRAMRGQAMLETTQTKGIVGKVAEASGPGGAPRPVIQHSAQVNPGNSGGPLFNECHQVVGVNTFVATSIFNIVRDKQGNTRAVGAAVAGHFYSPHSINLVKALKAEPALARIPVRINDSVCVPETPGGIPIWTYIVIAVFAILAMTALGLAIFRKNTTREIVKVVESYSAWVRRRAAGPGRARRPSSPARRRRWARRRRARRRPRPSRAGCFRASMPRAM
ncbi:MAG: serine protease [Bauldia litoralis]